MRLNTQNNKDKKWVELPNCAGLGDATGAFTNPKEVPLEGDLSNAAIATCKGPHPVATPPPAEGGSAPRRRSWCRGI